MKRIIDLNQDWWFQRAEDLSVECTNYGLPAVKNPEQQRQHGVFIINQFTKEK